MQPSEQTSSSVVDDRLSVLREVLRRKIGRRNYDLWFQNKVGLRYEGNTLYVEASSPFELTWMQRQFSRALNGVLTEVGSPSARLVFEVRAKPDSSPGTEAGTLASADLSLSDREPGQSGGPSRPGVVKSQTDRDPVTGQTRRLLSDFIVGPENELAHTASLGACRHPGEYYNPLVIYGGVGTGKTHLLDGIYWNLRRQNPRLNILRMTAETFANFFSQALSERTLPSFRHRMRSAEALLIDDIEFLDGKKVFQEEFLHTIKKLEESGRQMVFTSDRHPRLLEKSREEMTSRLCAGMLCRLETPGEETRRKIVAAKVRRMGMSLGPDVQAYVCSRFSRSVRELEGALNCLQHAASLADQPLSLTQSRSILADLERDCRHLIHLTDIEERVCRFFGLQPEELKSPSRAKRVSHPRMLAMFLSRKLTQTPYSAIGEHFGGRRHSTVVSAERTVQSWLETSKPLSISSREWSLSDVLGTLERELEVG